MSSHNTHSNLPFLYYITFTCWHRLPLVDLVNGYELVYSCFEFLKESYSIKTTSYVITLNHVHCILFFPTDQYDLSKIVANGKRFIAYEIIKRLKKKQSHKVLMQLQEGLSVKQLEKGQHHKVFEESFDANLFIIPNSLFRK